MKMKKLLSKADFIIIIAITLIYSIIALFNLGDTKAPQNYAVLNSGKSITITLDSDTDIGGLRVYLGPSHITKTTPLHIDIYDKGDKLTYSTVFEKGSVFSWTNLPFDNANGSKLVISADKKFYFMELGILDKSDNLIAPLSYPDGLCDEQELIPAKASYKNGTYFDEIYHARTAYEFTIGEDIYEWTHPPLGKVLISLGIQIFGMTPFGWRIIGTLFGIFMVPLIYVFLKRILKSTWLTACSCLLFTFDFMHFAQSRISTIDVYITFFIMLMYYYMYKYYDCDFKNTPLNKTFIPLALSGLFMGLGIATKWTGVYAGVGLAIIFFITLYNNKKVWKLYNKKALSTVYYCVLFFGAVPLIIYLLSYIQFINCEKTGLLGVWQNQVDMLTYHGKTVLGSTHYFESPWYEWPINLRPIWYYSGTNGDKVEVINSFGNPLVWWAGLIAFFYCLYDAVKNKDKTSKFLVISYLSQLAPWFFVARLTFIYHYFPSVPFIVLMIGYSVKKLCKKYKWMLPSFIAFTGLAVILFFVFYPTLSGYPASADYIKEYLRWLPTWYLSN